MEGEASKLIKVQVQGTREPPNPIAHTHLTGEEIEARSWNDLLQAEEHSKGLESTSTFLAFSLLPAG